MDQFTGPATPITPGGAAAFTTITRSGAREMWAVVAVETSGCGFLPDRRPKILFERHIFHSLTGGAFDRTHPGISQSSAGGYGPGGAAQYGRLAQALALNHDAALKSASWGIGQVLGSNFAACGFASVQAMVSAMVASEDGQLAAMAHFLTAGDLAPSLARHDWAGFARGYNGPDYVRNNYDGLLRQFYAHYAPGHMPDLAIRAVQVQLIYAGFDPLGIDGALGAGTQAAIIAFQTRHGLPKTGTLGESLIAALAAAQTTAKSPAL